jgi:hypothetical protein
VTKGKYEGEFTMDISTLVKRSWIVFLLLMLVACSGGGGSGDATPKLPNFSISPSTSSYDFGNIVLNSYQDRTFEITNTGSASLTIEGISISPSGVPFSVISDTDTCSNKTISANGTCSFTARYSPTSRVQSNATLSIPSNDPDTSTATIALSGEGYGSQLHLSESSYDFGGTVVSTSLARTFEITNTGNSSLTIGTISTSGLPFDILTDTCSGNTLSVNGTCSLIARFSPGDEVPFTGKLTIPSNDPEQITTTIGLSGEGYGLNVWINNIVSASPCNIYVDVSVTDPITGGIINLEITNFKLYLDSLDVSGDISVVQRENPSPVSVVLSIDWSESLTSIIGFVQAGAKTFLDQLSGDDEAAICKFNKAEVQTGLMPASDPFFYKAKDSTNFTKLGAFIDIPTFGNPGGTRLYDAVYASIERATHGNNVKRALVVLSDGHDYTSSSHSLDDVIVYAVTQGIPIFTIYYVDPLYQGGGYGDPSIMETLADGTGGQHYAASGELDLNNVYIQIANTLTNKYTITYNGTDCSATTAPLEVRVDWDSTGDGVNDLYGLASGTVTFP